MIDPLGSEKSPPAEGGSILYRRRVYGNYLSHRTARWAPINERSLKDRAPYLGKLIREHFPADREAEILDLGCGYGAMVHFARKAGYRNVVGIDRSPEQVAAAQRLGITGIREGDLIESLGLVGDESQDVVVSFDVIEHFKKDELLPFVDEVHRITRKGGKWILHTPNGEAPMGSRALFGDFTHEMAFTKESITQLLLGSGFRRVDCFEDRPIPHGVKSAVRWALWMLIRGMFRVYFAAEFGTWGRDCIFSGNFLTVAVK